MELEYICNRECKRQFKSDTIFEESALKCVQIYTGKTPVTEKNGFLELTKKSVTSCYVQVQNVMIYHKFFKFIGESCSVFSKREPKD